MTQKRQRAVDEALRARGIDISDAWWEIVEKLLGPTMLTKVDWSDEDVEAMVALAGAATGPIMLVDDGTTEKPRCPDCGLLTPHPALVAGDTVYAGAEYNIVCAGCGGLFQAKTSFRWTTTTDSCVKLNDEGYDDDNVYYEHGELA